MPDDDPKNERVHVTSVRFTDHDLSRLDRIVAKLDARTTKGSHSRTDAIRYAIDRVFAETERTR